MENTRQELFYEYSGAPYYFHSAGCMDAFIKTPEKYQQHHSRVHHHHNPNRWLWRMGGIFMGAMMLLMWL